MRSLSAGELLEVWEHGLLATPVERALLLLAAAEPELRPDALAALPVGERDARLLRLRERTFGPSLESVASCPACGERLELAVAVAELLGVAGKGDAGAGAPRRVRVGDTEVGFRLPTSLDLVAVAAAGDHETAKRALLARCIVEVAGDGEGAATALPDAAAAAVMRGMAEADPLADLELALSCPACGEAWSAPFDIGHFFWVEVDVWAARTLREVHALASAYGWDEAEILALSPQRRQAYLELVGA